MSDTVRTLGFEANVAVAGSIVPVAYSSSSTPISTAAIDSRLYPRARFLAIVQNASDATSTGVTPSVTKGATSSPVAAATANWSGAFVAQDGADACQFISIKVPTATPFFKVTLTPAGGSGVVSAVVLAIYDGL